MHPSNSTAGTLALSDFLLARIAEDEAVARTASPGPWHLADDESGDIEGQPERTPGLTPDGRPYDAYPATITDTESGYNAPSLENATHIARWDPARVLAECEAKRRIVEEHGVNRYRVDPCDAHDANLNTIPCDTLRFLALPYADHPDYRDEWKP